MILKEHIRCVINEAPGYYKINDLIRALNRVTREYNVDNRGLNIWKALNDVALDFGLEIIATGMNRIAYTMPQENWILKIAYSRGSMDDSSYKEALRSNKAEVGIGEGEHGLGARDLFARPGKNAKIILEAHNVN